MTKLHDYDKNNLTGELATLKEVQELLNSTEVPDYVHGIIKAQIMEVELNLKAGLDPRLER